MTVTDFKCPHPGCTKSYTRNYRLKEHVKAVHGVVVTECTKNFSCPFGGCVHMFRTNKELLTHCEGVHHDKIGIYTIGIITILYLWLMIL